MDWIYKRNNVFFGFDIIGTSRPTGLLPKIAFNGISRYGKKRDLIFRSETPINRVHFGDGKI